MPLTRPDLAALPGYVPGKRPSDLGVNKAVKLSANEVPFGPLPGVAEAIMAAVNDGNRYPDPGVLDLRDALAADYGIAPERIVTGCGSVGLCESLVRAVALPGDEVIYSWRSFEAYPIVSAFMGASSIRVPNTAEHGHDVGAMIEAITGKTRLIFVCNPNNPTGTALRRDELTALIDAAPADALVVLDEAYHEFVTDPEVPNGLAEFGDRDNVVILRTFSKAWGLAGLRVGWLVATPTVAEAVRKAVMVFSTNSVAQAAGVAALAARDEMERRVSVLTAERARVLAAVREVVPSAPDSQGNFVWLPLREQTAEFARRCEAAGVLVRPFAGEGVRVTIGTPEENDAFLRALRS